MTFIGYSYDELKSFLLANNPNTVFGEEIKPHTVKKIEFVAKYVEEWLNVVINVSDNFVFMDIMCNAGLYENDYLSTSINVLNVFIRFALNHPDKRFYLLTNDYNQDRVNTMKMLFNIYQKKFCDLQLHNVNMDVQCSDAVDYLGNINNKFHFNYMNGGKNSILVYVDPYRFIDLKLAEAVKSFSNNVYCELLINFYSNDYTRNVNNKSSGYQKDIVEFVSTFCNMNTSKINKAEAVRDKFINVFKNTKNIKYHYCINMKNKMNATLYYLIFLTPNIRGLEKVKEATWKIIGHSDEYCASLKDRDFYERNIFGETPEEEDFNNALNKLKGIICEYKYNELNYDQLLVICLQMTFMKKGHVIDKVIKPLIKEGFLKKKGLVGNRNFTQDSYLINKRS